MRQGDGCRPPLNSAICGGGGGASLLNCHLDSLQLKFPPFSNSPFFFFLVEIFSNFFLIFQGKKGESLKVVRIFISFVYVRITSIISLFFLMGNMEQKVRWRRLNLKRHCILRIILVCKFLFNLKRELLLSILMGKLEKCNFFLHSERGWRILLIEYIQ